MSRTQSPADAVDLLWQGRAQIGDEPGVYADAFYSGICVQFPVQLFAHSPTQSDASRVTFIIEVERVQVFDKYPGHVVELFSHVEDDGRSGFWREQSLASARLKQDRVEVTIEYPIPTYVSILIKIDTNLPPGLYDEIVIKRISLSSKSHYGLLGFRIR